MMVDTGRVWGPGERKFSQPSTVLLTAAKSVFIPLSLTASKHILLMFSPSAASEVSAAGASSLKGYYRRKYYIYRKSSEKST